MAAHLSKRGEPEMYAVDVATADPTDDPLAERLLARGLVDQAQLAQMRAYARQHGMSLRDAAIALNMVHPRDIDGRLPVPAFLQPGARTALQPTSEVVVAYETTDEVTDQFLEIRTQVQLRWLARGGPEHRLVSVVSPRRGDGRSFVAANLAVTFARIGYRTLLVDADLRHGRLHQLFKMEETAGLSALLTGKSRVGAVTEIGGLEHLAVLGRGASEPNPSDLIAHENFGTLLRAAANSFDVVIVDTPAALVAPEARLVAAMTKGCVLVARRNHSRREDLKRVERDLRDHGSTIIGTVLLDD